MLQTSEANTLFLRSGFIFFLNHTLFWSCIRVQSLALYFLFPPDVLQLLSKVWVCLVVCGVPSFYQSINHQLSSLCNTNFSLLTKEIWEKSNRFRGKNPKRLISLHEITRGSDSDPERVTEKQSVLRGHVIWCWRTWIDVLPDTPALLTTMCSAFSSSRILWANSLTDSMEDRSTRRRWTSEFPDFSLISLRAAVPRASLLQARITWAPRRAKSKAMNFPIPRKGS